MKYLAAFCTLIALVFAVPDRAVAKGPDLSLSQIRANTTRVKALSVVSGMVKTKPTVTQLRRLTINANNMRLILRAGSLRRSPDQVWANYIAPLNRCTDLVRKVCGVEKQCADSGVCPIAVQLLDEYNSLPAGAEQFAFEENCIITLSDNIVFPACE